MSGKPYGGTEAARYGYTHEDWKSVDGREAIDAQISQARMLPEASSELLNGIPRKRSQARARTPVSILLDDDLLGRLYSFVASWQARVRRVAPTDR
ncbi:hypothetical protein LUX29_01080 [Aureimonas altamirensis]|uniref:hypothetical protein n=1 Tax=Aureimonas altamirensis TaxID=370622 RepID=UPI001E30210E|nr:hypothetical protein [Aureimonas altamirensis]UHD45881.1 hypothetical protein LUX29_01080 [Aureimonas altamirensis]